jgi:hypothetical protein
MSVVVIGVHPIEFEQEVGQGKLTNMMRNDFSWTQLRALFISIDSFHRSDTSSAS